MSDKKEVRKDISLFTSLTAILNQEGGKLILKKLKDDLLGDINGLITEYKTATHIELLGRVASLAKSLALYRYLTTAETQKEFAQKELERILAIDPDDGAEDEDTT